MPSVIGVDDDAVSSLEQCIGALCVTGFDPGDEESRLHAATQLRRLGNNRAFLGDILIARLAERHREEIACSSYGPQVLMLKPPGAGDFFMRANIWPSPDESVMRASGGASFAYSLPHDEAVYVGAVLFAIGNGVMWPSYMAMLATLGPATRKGAIQGVAAGTAMCMSSFPPMPCPLRSTSCMCPPLRDGWTSMVSISRPGP